MDEQEQIEFAQAVLTKFVTVNAKRLRHGYRLRKQMHDAIERGEDPGDYRALWVKDGASRVIDLLQELAREFNAAHDDDRASAHDLADVLSTAMGVLKESVED